MASWLGKLVYLSIRKAHTLNSVIRLKQRMLYVIFLAPNPAGF